MTTHCPAHDSCPTHTCTSPRASHFRKRLPFRTVGTAPNGAIIPPPVHLLLLLGAGCNKCHLTHRSYTTRLPFVLRIRTLRLASRPFTSLLRRRSIYDHSPPPHTTPAPHAHVPHQWFLISGNDPLSVQLALRITALSSHRLFVLLF